jgi:hypothetical protein
LVFVGLAGDLRVGVTPSKQTEVPYLGPTGTQSSVDDLPRVNVASRSLLRTEIAAAPTESPAPIDPPAAVAPEPEPEPVVQVAPRPTPAPYVAPTCAAYQFCYPRVGIAGTIVPYNDCTGKTDVGTAIRSIVCVSPTYLAAHAYTQFGRIAGWRAGDVVFAYGARYVIVDGFTQAGCVPPARAIAPLSLQTSLTPATCGPILVVQARPG